MIIFKTLSWDNFFSYGANNFIDFTDAPVTQLVGLNGVGKTSIPLIIQEMLYGKNVKRIIKANLLNRNLDENFVKGQLEFTVDEQEYTLRVLRRNTKLTVALFKGDEDISSHTTPNTMKSVENILGLDFDTFSQLVYQSSKSNLQFLTATDTQRKKFLVTLFNLERYIEIHEIFKKVLIEINKEVAEVNGRYTVYETWLSSNKNITEEMELLNLPENPNKEQEQLTELRFKKEKLTEFNRKISNNNTYKAQLHSIDKTLLEQEPHNIEELETLKDQKISTEVLMKEKQKLIEKLDGLSPICPACKQSIDIEDSKILAEDYKKELEIFWKNFKNTLVRLEILEEHKLENSKIEKAIQSFENLVNLIDYELDTETESDENLDKLIDSTNISIKSLLSRITVIKDKNNEIIKFNTKIKIQDEQRVDYNIKLLKELNILEELFDKVQQLEILKDAFGTNGLVSYKLEYLSKDLESVINEYLEDLSRGRFQLNFILKDDKLNIEIVDEGQIITINELSEGELAKVNVSTLLAIRKLMQNLSNTKLNLLFLDEIMGVLDTFGREDLIGVLLREDSLNTYLVTHEYRHPLVPVINVIQENKISRIEHD